MLNLSTPILLIITMTIMFLNHLLHQTKPIKYLDLLKVKFMGLTKNQDFINYPKWYL